MWIEINKRGLFLKLYNCPFYFGKAILSGGKNSVPYRKNQKIFIESSVSMRLRTSRADWSRSFFSAASSFSSITLSTPFLPSTTGTPINISLSPYSPLRCAHTGKTCLWSLPYVNQHKLTCKILTCNFVGNRCTNISCSYYRYLHSNWFMGDTRGWPA